MPTKVSLVRCDDYATAKVEAAILAAINLLGGMAHFVKPSQKVLIKPNILNGEPPERGVATHPEVVRAVVRLVKEAGGIPYVGDSPGFAPARGAARSSGILKIIEEEGAIFSDFSHGREVVFADGVVCKNVMMAEAVLDADVVINLAKLKSHNYSGITAAVKNLFGCIPGLVKSQLHFKYPRQHEFDLMLLDILRLVKPVLSLVDAVVAMEGEGGPANGELLSMNLIVAGGDAVAVDAVCAALTGKQPLDFNFLKMAAQQKVGETNLSNIEVVGEEITRWIFREFKHVSIQKDAMLPAWLPAFLTAWMRSLLLDRPALRRRKCRRCGVCAKICAARAITLSKGRPVFNYNKCIGCYCCQEMCNFAAIKIRKSFLARVIFKISALFG